MQVLGSHGSLGIACYILATPLCSCKTPTSEQGPTTLLHGENTAKYIRTCFEKGWKVALFYKQAHPCQEQILVKL